MARGITIQRNVSVRLTPSDLAEAFSCLDADEQAEFFAEADGAFSDWSNGARDVQLAFIADRACKCDEAMRFIRDLADYINARTSRSEGR